jgi:hypothetical protein
MAFSVKSCAIMTKMIWIAQRGFGGMEDKFDLITPLARIANIPTEGLIGLSLKLTNLPPS